MNLTISILRFFGQSFTKTLALAAIITGLQAASVAAQPVIAIGPDARHVPVVKRITVNAISGNDILSFAAYRRNFTGGVRVAVGDVNGDGVADIITGPGPGTGTRINVFDGVTGDRLRSFLAFTGFYRGGVFVAAGDVNGDGKADIIVGTDSGAPPIVRVFDGAQGNLIRSFFAYSPLFTGGVRVAAGDVNGDGVADIITGPGAGGGPNVKVFDGTNGALLQSFFAYSPGFLGGVYVAAGDVNGDGSADIVTGPGSGGGPQVKAFDGVTLETLKSFFAYDPTFQGGVRVAAGDVNGDGLADIVTGAGPGAGPLVKVFESQSLSLLHSFFAYEANFTGGVFVAALGPRRRVGGR